MTCGSTIKLLNTRHDVRLHSHEVNYGGGSGQQVRLLSLLRHECICSIRNRVVRGTSRFTQIHSGTSQEEHSHSFRLPSLNSSHLVKSTNLVLCLINRKAAAFIAEGSGLKGRLLRKSKNRKVGGFCWHAIFHV